MLATGLRDGQVMPTGDVGRAWAQPIGSDDERNRSRGEAAYCR